MIITLTINPALDRTLCVKKLVPGTVMLVEDEVICAGGKGINVSRALKKLGAPTRAVFFSGGHTGSRICELLEEEGLDFLAVPVKAETRVSVQVSEEGGRFSNLNARGGPVTASEAADIVTTLRSLVGKDDTLVLSGSAPDGIDCSFYAELVREFKGRCRAVAADTAGGALAAVCKAGPRIIKPNEDELAGLMGRPFKDDTEMFSFAGSLGLDIVIITLGSRGAACVSGGRRYLVGPRDVNAVSTVGAGDSFLAGFLHAYLEDENDIPRALAAGSAVSSAKVELQGTRMPETEHALKYFDTQRVRVL